MEARTLRWALCACLPILLGASYRTENFIVNAPTQAIATQVGDSAESFRKDIAMDWLGEPLPSWGQPCPITVQVGERLGAGGATSFVFDRGEVYGWQMNIQGSLERILDSVLPHEVTHTIFATHFRQPLPRWADEGACTTVEHSSERTKQQQMLIQFLKTGRGISFSSMFAMKEYPADVLPLYAQGHSLASYFIAQGGKKKFLKFVADGLQDENWTRTVNAHYGFADLRTLQNTWLEWVRTGSPPLQQSTPTTPAPAIAAQPNIVPANVIPTSNAAPITNVPLNAVAQTDNFAAATSPAPAVQWTSTANSNRKRERPTPNLLHQVAPSSGINANATASAATLFDPALPGPAAQPNLNVPPAGPLVPIPPPSSGIAAAQSGPMMSGASRPQQPESPKQIVLEWAKSEQPVSAYSSGAQPQSIPAGAPLYDAGLSSGVMRR